MITAHYGKQRTTTSKIIQGKQCKKLLWEEVSFESCFELQDCASRSDALRQTVPHGWCCEEECPECGWLQISTLYKLRYCETSSVSCWTQSPSYWYIQSHKRRQIIMPVMYHGWIWIQTARSWKLSSLWLAASRVVEERGKHDHNYLVARDISKIGVSCGLYLVSPCSSNWTHIFFEHGAIYNTHSESWLLHEG